MLQHWYHCVDEDAAGPLGLGPWIEPSGFGPLVEPCD